MKTTDTGQIERALGEVGVGEGANLLVHSDLAALGVLVGGLPTLFDALRGAIGPGGTIATPAYRFAAAADEPYDRLESPSIGVGAFSEFVRKAEGTERTQNPIHSHSVNGPLAGEAAARRNPPSFGQGSDFDFFAGHGFRGLYVGCGFEKAGTLVIHAEALAGNIPYRRWEVSQRTVLAPDGQGGKRAETFEAPYYARSPGAPRETRVGLEAELRSAGLLSESRIAYGPIISFDVDPVCGALVAIFERDPMASAIREGTAP